jgi:hypothetical protein
VTDATELTHTAYPSGSAGLWTVWDHVNDQAVRTDLPEADAVRLAAELTNNREDQG